MSLSVGLYLLEKRGTTFSGTEHAESISELNAIQMNVHVLKAAVTLALFKSLVKTMLFNKPFGFTPLRQR